MVRITRYFVSERGSELAPVLVLRLTSGHHYRVDAAKVRAGSVELFKTGAKALEFLRRHDPCHDRVRLNLIQAP